jgi:hypothetical protein
MKGVYHGLRGQPVSLRQVTVSGPGTSAKSLAETSLNTRFREYGAVL